MPEHELVLKHHDPEKGIRYYAEEAPGTKKKYPVEAISKFKMPRVFSIFCQGTGGHRYGKCKELITEFHNAYYGRSRTAGAGTEESDERYKKHYFKSFLILDGPGTSDHEDASGHPIGLQGPPHPMPGDFLPCSFDKPLKPSARNTDRTVERRVSQMTSEMAGLKSRGDIWGDGWNDNVAHALFVLKALLDKDEFPDVINLIGWSRGAVTTIKIANAVERYFVKGEDYTVHGRYDHDENERWSGGSGGRITRQAPDYVMLEKPAKTVPREKIEINIFAIDPVPGRFGKSVNGNGSWGGSDEDKEEFPPGPDGAFGEIEGNVQTSAAGELDYRKVPDIVKDCIITLALDERRTGFAPLCAGWTEKVPTTEEYEEACRILNDYGPKRTYAVAPGRSQHGIKTKHDVFNTKPSEDKKGAVGYRNSKLVYDPQKTRLLWLPFPGIHRSQLRMVPRDPGKAHASDSVPVPNPLAVCQKLVAVPHLVFDLAWRFLVAHGTVFETNLLAEPAFGGAALGLFQVLDRYSDVWVNRENYHKTRTVGPLHVEWRRFTGYRPVAQIVGKTRVTGVGAVPGNRLFTKALKSYVKCPGFFINEHHRACFQMAFPELYRFLTAGSEADLTVVVEGSIVNITNAGALKDITYVYKNRTKLPNLWLALLHAGIEDNPDWADRGTFTWDTTRERGENLGHKLVGVEVGPPPIFRIEAAMGSRADASDSMLASMGVMDYKRDLDRRKQEEGG